MTEQQNGAPLPDAIRRKVWVAAEDLANAIGCTVVVGRPGTFPPKPDTRDAERRNRFEEIELDQRCRERDEAREEWKRADADVTRLADELRAIRHKLAVELNLKPSELVGRETTDLAVELADRRGKSVIHWQDLAAGCKRELDQHLADENSAQAANDRLREENDRLRQVVTEQIKQRPAFGPGQRVRIGDCPGTVHAPRDITRVKLDGIPIAHDYETRFVRPTPYEEEVPF